MKMDNGNNNRLLFIIFILVCLIFLCEGGFIPKILMWIGVDLPGYEGYILKDIQTKVDRLETKVDSLIIKYDELK